jgi:hypothetical protein
MPRGESQIPAGFRLQGFFGKYIGTVLLEIELIGVTLWQLAPACSSAVPRKSANLLTKGRVSTTFTDMFQIRP